MNEKYESDTIIIFAFCFITIFAKLFSWGSEDLGKARNTKMMKSLKIIIYHEYQNLH